MQLAPYLKKLASNQSLKKSEAENALNTVLELASSTLTDETTTPENLACIGAFLALYTQRIPTKEEMIGFITCLYSHGTQVELGIENNAYIDLCGTGGDGKNTFNISTISSFIVAGAGYKVAKHGNSSATSSCGSSNTLQRLGIKLTDCQQHLKKAINETNICNLFAPLFLRKLGSVKTIRQTLGFRTIFNMLGPLVNPAKPAYQMLGIANDNQVDLYKETLKDLRKDFSIVHSLDGYDEISLTGQFIIATPNSTKTLSPEDIGLKTINPKVLEIGNIKDGSSQDAENIALAKFNEILSLTTATDASLAVIANSAVAINTLNRDITLQDCIRIAKDSIFSGKAKNIFEKHRDLK